MKKFVIQSVFLIIVFFVALAVYTSKITTIPFVPIPQTVKTEALIINNNRINIEVADAQEKRNKGLSGRESLASDSGMLFVFPKEDKYTFWMKGVNFPIDFIWIKDDRVVDLLPKVPPAASNQDDQSLPRYSSKEPINKVLEVNAGTIERLNIKVGDKIQVVNQ